MLSQEVVYITSVKTSCFHATPTYKKSHMYYNNQCKTYSSFVWYVFCQLSRLLIHNHHLVLSWEKRSYTNTSCLEARSVHLTTPYPVAIVSQIQPPTSAALILQEMRKPVNLLLRFAGSIILLNFGEFLCFYNYMNSNFARAHVVFYCALNFKCHASDLCLYAHGY